jgi:hypothetical protein
MHARSHACRLLQLIALPLLLIAAWTGRAAAQSQAVANGAPHELPVVILGVAGDEEIGRGRVLIRGTGKETAVIVVPLTARPADLADAFKIVRKTRPGLARKDSTSLQRIDLKPVAQHRTLSPAEEVAYTLYIKKFKTAPLVTIPGAGRGRSVRVELGNKP